jgi:hypothetical protein
MTVRSRGREDLVEHEAGAEEAALVGHEQAAQHPECSRLH